MFTTITKVAKGLAAFTLVSAFAAAVGPLFYEMKHNDNQQDKIEEAIQKITQEKFFVCKPAAAGPLQHERAAQLAQIMTKAIGEQTPAWDHPLDIYFSDVKRITNTMPSAVLMTKKVFSGIPADYHKGSYQTQLDSSRRNAEDLAKLGIGMCFDTNAANAGAGSIFDRTKGIIILNPALAEKSLVTHVSRQLSRLDQDVVKPYDRLVTNGSEQRTAYDVRMDQMETFVRERSENPLLALPNDGDPNTVDFRTLDRKSYNTAQLLNGIEAPAADTKQTQQAAPNEPAVKNPAKKPVPVKKP